MTGDRQQTCTGIRSYRNKICLIVACCLGYALTGIVVLYMYHGKTLCFTILWSLYFVPDYCISITALAPVALCAALIYAEEVADSGEEEEEHCKDVTDKDGDMFKKKI